METQSTETIDRLFACLEKFYGERWKKFIGQKEVLYKTLWQSALISCTHDEIKAALVYLSSLSKNPYSLPPNHLEFHRYVRNVTAYPQPQPQMQKIQDVRNKEAGLKALSKMNEKFNFRSKSKTTVECST